eukprot:c6911_g1_i1.p1 GENE.c6911_g1_i1~~c6911_g1_i1.p1  ORF type:complete len:617 (-),score=173.17 c6911_g1_i1:78-1928(-)
MGVISFHLHFGVMACVAVRSKNGVYVYRPLQEAATAVLSTQEALMALSKDGTAIAVTCTEGVKVYRLPSPSEPLLPELECIATILSAQPIRMLSFSPRASFLVTGHRWSKEESGNNVILWSLVNGDPVPVNGFIQKVLNRESWPLCHWSLDEKWMVRLTGNEVLLFNGLDPSVISHRFRVESVTSVSIAPCPFNGRYYMGVFVPEDKATPGRVSVIRLPVDPSPTTVFVDTPDVTGAKSMFKAQTVEMLWNPTGNSLLAKTQTDVDTTGKTYYGESNLIFLKADGSLIAQVNPGVEGAIHSMEWSPSGKEFIVIAGLMPAKILLFNSICQSKFDFGSNHRNTIRFSPSGRLLCLGGFGNLMGDMDFYEKKGSEFELLGSATAQCAVTAEWSPDGRHLLTSVCAPRMRVDNAIKLWKYTAEVVLHEPFEVLYETAWQNCRLPEAPLSPRTGPAKVSKSVVPEKPKAYRAPGSSGALAERLRQERATAAPQKISQPAPVPRQIPVNLPPGADVEEYLKMLKKKEKEQKKKEKKDAEKQTTAPEPAPAPTPTPAEPAESAVDLDKRIKALKKKLKQIDQIKASVAEGKPIDAAQQEKLGHEKGFLEELAECEKKQQASP